MSESFRKLKIDAGVSYKNFEQLNSSIYIYIWVFPKIRVPQNGWFKMDNPIKMDDLGVPLFLETPIYDPGLATPPLPLRGEIPRGCPGLTTPQAVNSVFTRTIASAKS